MVIKNRLAVDSSCIWLVYLSVSSIRILSIHAVLLKNAYPVRVGPYGVRSKGLIGLVPTNIVDVALTTTANGKDSWRFWVL